MKLSIVSTLYQSAPYIKEFCSRVTASAQQLVGDDYEIILVNDGSPDSSLDIAVSLTEKDSHLMVVDLSRNFGHHKAMMTGLAHTKGELVFLLDSDLEEEPEWLIMFWEKMAREKPDVVYGVQKTRKGSLNEKVSGYLFWRFLHFMSPIDIPQNQVLARLMTSRYVEALLLFKENEIFFAGIAALAGYEQVPKEVCKGSHSLTTYHIKRKLSQAVDGIASLSEKPLKLIFYAGMLTTSIAVTVGTYIIFEWLMHQVPPIGWVSVMLSVWFLGGVTLTSLGVIGIYMSKIFLETKVRPRTVIRSVKKK